MNEYHTPITVPIGFSVITASAMLLVSISGRKKICKGKFKSILEEENELLEIARVVGQDVLSDSKRLVLEVAKAIRVGFLQQNAFHADDTYVPLEKQNKMMDIILLFDKRIKECVEKGVVLSKVSESGIAEDIIRIKYTIGNDNIDGPFHDLQRKINETFDKLIYNHES